MKHNQIQKELEDIIYIFKKVSSGLSTQALFEILKEEYGFSRDIKTLQNRLKFLASDGIEDVECILKPRGRHLLVDRRFSLYEKKHKAYLEGEEKAYMRLALQAIKELPSLSVTHSKRIEEKLDLMGLCTPYFIESKETEKLEPTQETTSELIYAIKRDYLVKFGYTDDSSDDVYVVEPYKLIVFDGLWYLFGKDINEKDTPPYKTWRVKYIEAIEIDMLTKHDIDDSIIEDVLQKANDADFVVEDMHQAKVKSVKVKVKIDKSIEDEVLLSGFVSKIYDEKSDSYIITCDVSITDEIDNEIKSWLPHIEVLEPLFYKEQFEKEIREYVQRLG